MRKFYPILAAAAVTLSPFGGLLWAQAPAAKDDPIAKIKEEGLNHSQVMKTLSYLTDVIGPRVTGTPALKRANEWTRDEMTHNGLVNAHLEAWGPFGRGWTLKHFEANTVAPQVRPLEAYPKCWSPDVEVKDADVVHIDAKTAADLEQYKGKLKGKVVLAGPAVEVKPHLTPEGTRRDEKNLLDLANADANAMRRGRTESPEMRSNMRQAFFRTQRRVFFQQEGVALLLEASRAGDGGNIFVQQASANILADTSSWEAFRAKQPQVWDAKPPAVTPQLAVAVEAYNRMVRTLAAGEKVKVSVSLKGQFHGEDLMAYNTVAELPGTDKKDEIVMLVVHLDSWHGGTGATDNACGVAVCMEAVRILKAAGLQPRRTIRVALWSGEEQGLFGSENYVKQHFGEVVKDKDAPAGSPTKVTVKPEWSKLAAYFNLDNGAGKIRGVYMQGNEAVRPIFQPWLDPFKDLGASTLTLTNTGGTDHLSFDAVGLPGFQFIQDELEYDTRTHHSTQDVFDRAPEADMKQAATIMAAFIYNAAMRDEMLPRKPVQVVK
jgi:hypothetical protein